MSRLNKIDPAWLHSSKLFRDVMYQITFEFSEWVLRDSSFDSKRLRHGVAEQLVEIVRDPNPEESLRITANHPMLLFRPGFVSGPVPPQEQWKRLEEGSKFWPLPIRRAARHLGVGSGELPSWKSIDRYFTKLGIEAVPVRGYLGAPLYNYLISTNRAPVCTNWVLRFKKAPYYGLPVDTLHDLGHGLGLAMPDYRELLVAFARAALKSGRFLLSRELDIHYGRMFEYSFVLADDGSIEPIGAGPLGMETLRLHKGKLRSIVKDPKEVRNQSYEFQPFGSREEWRQEIKKFVDSIPSLSRKEFRINR